MGGQVGVADHVTVGAGATFMARTALAPGFYAGGGAIYGGVPAKPRMDWARELAAVARLAKGKKSDV
jgi:UDP-3-O-[3-hydroxymyristoyl] glucosamine N-acyltransferase